MKPFHINEDIITAGAYLLYKGCFPFMVGYGKDRKNGLLGLVRFGGHRENNEEPTKCVIREVKEETALDIKFFSSPITYIMRAPTDDYEKEKVKFDDIVNPVLIRRGTDNKLSLMYFAYGDGEISPSMETQGILMLTPEDIRKICKRSITLDTFINQGGKALFAETLPGDYIIKPAIQLQFLNNLLIKEPELIEEFRNHQL